MYIVILQFTQDKKTKLLDLIIVDYEYMFLYLYLYSLIFFSNSNFLQ